MLFLFAILFAPVCVLGHCLVLDPNVALAPVRVLDHFLARVSALVHRPR